MPYKVQELAALSGVSARTLRYYDAIGLLRPARTESGGYRVYGAAEVDLLQQILFYRALGMPLAEIRAAVTAGDFDRERALQRHLIVLREKQAQLGALIESVERTIRAGKEGIPMTDSEKFAALKRQKLEENERKYGKEVRARFGDEAMDAANAKFAGMSEAQVREAEALEAEILTGLGAAAAQGDPASEAAQRVCALHRRWLCLFWKDGSYSKAAHLALAEGYTADPRFAAYYDRAAPGAARFLRDALAVYCRSEA